MERKRLLWGYGVVTIIVAAFILVLVLALSKPSSQPAVQPVAVTASGTLTCLPHKNVPGQAYSTICAIGLRTDDGRYYSLQNLSSQDSQTDSNKRVYVTGTSLPPPADTTYDIVGELKVTKFSTSHN